MKGRSFPFKGIIAYPPRCQGPIYYFLVFAFFSSVRAEGARVYFEFYALFYAYLFFHCFRLFHGAKRQEGSKKAPAWQALCDGFVENAGVCIIFVKMNFGKFPARPSPNGGRWPAGPDGGLPLWAGGWVRPGWPAGSGCGCGGPAFPERGRSRRRWGR